MIRWTAAAILVGGLVAAPAWGDNDPRMRVSGTTLQDFEQKVFGTTPGAQGGAAQGNTAQQAGLAGGETPFEARFRDVSVNNQQQLQQDMQKLNTIPEGSRVRLQGTVNGRPFRAEVRNHEGVREYELRGLQFKDQTEAQNFVKSLQTGGAERVRVRGVLDNGQRFDARYRVHNGRVEQRFQVKKPEHHGTTITSASGRSHVEGARTKVEGEHGRRLDSDHGRKDAGQQGLRSGSGRDSGDRSFSGGDSNRGGHGGRGKD